MNAFYVMLSDLNRNSMQLEPIGHMEFLVKYRPHILLQRELLEEWQDDLQKLQKKSICKHDISKASLPLFFITSKRFYRNLKK